MKKFTLLALLAMALAVPSIAAAATAQGQLTGTAVLSSPGGQATLEITTTVIDGGMSFVGLENDYSGICTGDSGVVKLTIPSVGSSSDSIVCAHFITSSRDGSGPKMRFAVPFTLNSGYLVYRISDGGAGGMDKVAVGIVSTLAGAQAWVNTGAVGSGHPLGWIPNTVLSGGYTVTP